MSLSTDQNIELIIEALDGGWSTAFEILNLPIPELKKVVNSLGISHSKANEYLQALAGNDELKRLLASQELLVDIIVQEQQLILQQETYEFGQITEATVQLEYQTHLQTAQDPLDSDKVPQRGNQLNLQAEYRTSQILDKLEEQKLQVLERISRAMEVVQRS